MLTGFADRYDIDYHLLSDTDSAVIDAFGIRNEHIPAEHKWYGVPYPGMYLVDADGRVFDKHFDADHAVRESVGSALQERFAVQVEPQGAVTFEAPGLCGRAWFTTPVIRRAQLTVLTVDLTIAAGRHAYGQPLPDGYIPLEMSVDGGEGLQVQRLDYPDPQPFRFDAIDETLPAYEGHVRLKAHCIGRAREGQLEVDVTLRYQTCDEVQCFLPEQLSLRLPLDVEPHGY